MQVVGNKPVSSPMSSADNVVHYLDVDDVNCSPVADVHAFHQTCEHYTVNIFTPSANNLTTASAGDDQQDLNDKNENDTDSNNNDVEE